MALQFSAPIRNAVLDTVESQTGTAPTLTFLTGAPPATADAGIITRTANGGRLI